MTFAMNDQPPNQAEADRQFYQENKAGYLHDWIECLRALLGWPQQQVYKWSEQWQRGLDGLDKGMFYHETPIWRITPLMIPDSLAARMNPTDLLRLEGRIEAAIRHPGSDVPYGTEAEETRENFDWSAAKQRVEAVLNEYGETLESVQFPVMVQRVGSKYSSE